jgi:uncharacterized membrane protein YkoI
MQNRLHQRDGKSRRTLAALARRAAALLVLALMVAPQASLAASPDWRRGVQEQLEPNTLVRPPGITLEQAADEVRRQTGGRVLSASPAERSGQRGYEVRVLLDGKRVKSYFVDGQGRVRGRD